MNKYFKFRNYQDIEADNTYNNIVYNKYKKHTKINGLDNCEILSISKCKCNEPKYSHKFCHCIKCSSKDNIYITLKSDTKLFESECN